MIKIQRNLNGTPQTNHSAHTANLICDFCGTLASGVNMNVNAFYVKNSDGTNAAIALKCSIIGGSCNIATCWPLSNGTADAQEMAMVKTA